jgi:hypothetical protein
MLDYLRRLAVSFLRRRSPFHPFNPPADPYAAVREPRPARPGGRSSAVALEEPPPTSTARAIGRSRTIALLVAAGLLVSQSIRAQALPPPSEKTFVSGGRIDLQLPGGEYQIKPAADNRIRVSLTRNPGSSKVDIATNANAGTVKITNSPTNNFSATIEVPKAADLTVRLSGGALTIAEITGSKDVESYGGDVTIAVGDPNQYSSVDAAVKVGDLRANPFGESKSGLLQSFRWSGKGKYTLRARLGAGDLVLK